MDEHLYETFADVAEDHWWFEGRRKVVEAVLHEALPPTGPGVAERQIIDVGCGTGSMLGMLGQFGQVQGIEMYPDAIATCHAIYGDAVPVQLGRIPDDLPTDSSFDLVGAFDVIEHIEDDFGVVKHIHDLLRPGGLFVVTVPAFPLLWGVTDVMSHHCRRYRTKGLVEVLTAAGLEVERTTYFNTWLFPPVAAIRVGRRIIPGSRNMEKPDLALTSGRVDGVLTRVFASERHVVRKHSFPFGVSLLALARRPS